jgi:TetR/AcrR family transcriptional repressor of nem operon
MREKIKAHAIEVVRAHGSRGLNFRDLGAALGVKSSSIHYYYPTKADLLEEMLRDYQGIFMKELDARVSSAKSLAKTLEGLLSFFEEAQEKKLICLGGALATEFNDMEPKVNRAVQDFFATLEDWVVAKVKKFESKTKLSAEDFSRLFVSALEGALIIGRPGRENGELQAVRRWLRHI